MGCGITPPWKLTGLGVPRYECDPGCRGRGCAGCTIGASAIDPPLAGGFVLFEIGEWSMMAFDLCFVCSGLVDDGFWVDVADRKPLDLAFARHSSHAQLPCRTPSLGRVLDSDLLDGGL